MKVMKTTVGKISEAFQVIDAAKTTTLEMAERQQVVKIWYALSEEGEKYASLVEKSRKELMPQGMEEFVGKVHLTQEEYVRYAPLKEEYARALEGILKPASEKEIEIELPCKLSLDVVLKLSKENDWPTSRLRDLAIIIDKNKEK